VISFSEVRFAWSGRDSFSLAVDAFRVARGERLLLVGPSGAGKSTLLNLLCGVVSPRAGSIRVLGTEIGTLSQGARDRFRAEHFGVIFQMFNLLPYGTVLDNVLLPLSFAPGRRARAARERPAADEARALLTALGLEEALCDGPSAVALSVGQQQRVAAARALIGAPEIVVADEPTSALDTDRQRIFLDLLFDQLDRAGATLVMVSHEAALAPRFDRVVALDDIATAGRAGPR
jgi:putative ABC transport system ATP-binding protein